VAPGAAATPISATQAGHGYVKITIQ
jgi:hypothetical protein